MGVSFAQQVDDHREESVGACAHVLRLGTQPQRIDADHRSSSRSQALISAVADIGQAMCTDSGPRRSSISTR